MPLDAHLVCAMMLTCFVSAAIFHRVASPLIASRKLAVLSPSRPTRFATLYTKVQTPCPSFETHEPVCLFTFLLPFCAASASCERLLVAESGSAS